MSFPPLPIVQLVPPREPEDAQLDNLTNELILTATRGENCMHALGRRIVYMCTRFEGVRADERLRHRANDVIHENFELMRSYRGRAWRDDGLEITTAVPRIDKSQLWIDMIAPGPKATTA
jgi:hypothetical protein